MTSSCTTCSTCYGRATTAARSAARSTWYAVFWRARAEADLPKIADPENRQTIEQDLATLPI